MTTENFSFCPKDWEDDLKMTVMFSPFRERNLNPKSWEQKVKFWSELILENCVQTRQAVVNLQTLKENFRRKGKSPTCLDTVLQQMISKGQLKRLSGLENSDSEGWLKWGYSTLVKKPIGWSLKWLSGQPENTKADEAFVVMDVIKAKAKELLEVRRRLAHGDTIDIVEYDHLRKEHKLLCPSDTEFSLVMKELVDGKEVLIQKGEDSTKLVKFLHKDTEKKADKIEEQDIHIHRIQKAHAEVKRQIDILSSEVHRLGAEAVSQKQKGMTKQAMSCMRKRKLAQNRIDKLMGSMDMLEDILYRIKQAESNEMIVKAIEGGTAVLKDMTGKITADDVVTTMDNLADVTQTQDEIVAELNTTTFIDEPSQEELEEELSEILNESAKEREPAKPTKVTRVVSKEDVDLEKELQDILNESGESGKIPDNSMRGLEEMLDDLQLPDVPSHSPGSVKTGRQLLTS